MEVLKKMNKANTEYSRLRKIVRSVRSWIDVYHPITECAGTIRKEGWPTGLVLDVVERIAERRDRAGSQAREAFEEAIEKEETAYWT